MSKELDEAWTTIYHYNDEIIHDMGSEYVDNPLKEEIDIVNNALLELKAIKEAKPSEALKWLDQIIEYITEDKKVKYKATILFDCEIIKDALLKAQEMEKGNVYCAGGRSFSKEVIYLKQSIEQCNDKPIYYISRSFGNKYIVPQKIFEEQEKENELLKEIIKSLFDRGCPLHQYIDSKGVLQIEVDDECSNMRLGEYKGVDLDKKLKEVLG